MFKKMRRDLPATAEANWRGDWMDDWRKEDWKEDLVVYGSWLVGCSFLVAMFTALVAR